MKQADLGLTLTTKREGLAQKTLVYPSESNKGCLPFAVEYKVPRAGSSARFGTESGRKTEKLPVRA